MPELPEVEISRLDIAPFLVGNVISHTIIYNSKLRWPISTEIYNLRHQPILDIERRAKYLLLKLPLGWIIIHLGMSGRLKILSNYSPITKHDHWDFIMIDGKILRYFDPRRFGCCLWSTNLINNKLLSYKGLEPLSTEFNAEYLFKKFYKKNKILKPLLMTNIVVVGIGNIYANESLFKSGILPFRLAMSLNIKEIELLVDAIKSILQIAIKHGGTTISDFLRINNNSGNFTKKLKVYGRYGKQCFICQNLINKKKYNNRSTYWCEYCQN